MRTSGKVLKDFENLRKALFDEEISHMAFMRDGKVEILYTQKYVDKLEKQLQQKENIIKEVRELANKITKKYWSDDGRAIVAEKILEILDKVDKE